MKQYEAVIQTIESLGGIATLGQINQDIFKIEGCEWKTKTPYASIRRIVQTDKNIYKIKPGLYALEKHRTKFNKQGIFAEDSDKGSQKTAEEFNHSYYQGLILEIGNMKGMDTYIPAQDKNKRFLNKPLKEISSIDSIYEFTYQPLVKRAKTIDVIWFNDRKFPSSIFEIEHSTNMVNSLLKFNDFRDFYTKFYIVSFRNRKGEFIDKLKYSSFKGMEERIEFLDYDSVSSLHTKMSELHALRQL